MYIRLGAVTPAGTNEDDASVLAHWVDQAGYARRDGVPKVTKQGIESDVFAFFLDGLDEVWAEKRASVLRTIGNLAARYSQHRWVLTSRRVPELPVGSLNGFAEYEMAPTREWLIRYAEQRGVTQTQLDQIAQRAPGLGELLEIPLFAAAAVEAIIAGRKLPASPLELLLSFASKGMDEEETRLRSDREGIDRWLDRLALTMLAQRVDSIDRQRAVTPALRGDLAEDVTVDWLVARVLVAEQGGEVRFASRTLRDSRAARAIREHPDAAAALTQLATVDIDGERHLRPEWQYVTDLLLTSDHDTWANTIQPVDPLAVARATPQSAAVNDRATAIEAIDNWYRNHRIFIPRTHEGQLVDDLTALETLAHDGLPSEIRDRLIADLGSVDMALRANAVAVLSSTGHIEELKPHLQSLLADQNQVVRRRTAQAILEHGLSAFATELADRALSDGNDLSRRTLAESAIEVADDTDVNDIIRRLPRDLRRDAQLAIDRRLSRDQQLTLLATHNQPDEDWLDHLTGLGAREGWTSAEIETLGELWARAGRYHGPATLDDVLLQQPASALRGALRASGDIALLMDHLFLLEALTDDELTALADDTGPKGANLVTSYKNLGERPVRRRAESHSTPTSADLASLVQEADLDAVLELQPNSSEVNALDPTDRSALVELVQSQWRDPANGTTPLQRIERVEPGRWNASHRDWRLADLAARLQLPLTEDEWLMAVELSLSDSDQHRSLASTYDRAWDNQVIAALPDFDNRTLTYLIASLPDPWADDLAAAVAQRCFTATLQDTHRDCAERLAADGRIDLLRSWATSRNVLAIDAVLVRSNDSAAERRLLTDYRDRQFPRLQYGGTDADWIPNIHHSENANLVIEALRTMLRRGDEVHEIEPLFKATNRTLGEAALHFYDELIADETIPDASFLWYRRQDCIAYLATDPKHDTSGTVEQLLRDS